MLLPAIALVLLLLAVWAVRSEPRRASNAVICGLAALSWLLVPAQIMGPSGVRPVRLVALSPLLGVPLVLVLLCNGMLMLHREGRRPANLLSAGAGVLLVLAVALSARLVFAFDDRVLLGLGLWLALAVAWVGFLFAAMVLYQDAYATFSKDDRRPDYVVALGAGLVRGKVGRLLANRVKGAAELAGEWGRPGSAPLLVMSGGQGPDEPRPEAEAMAEYARETLGVPAEGILLEDKSRTTEENLQLTAAVVHEHPELGPGARGVVVTNNFHVLRTAELARRLGVEVQVVAAPVVWYYWPSAILREFVAQIFYHPRLFVLATVLVTVPLPVAMAWASSH